MQDVTDLPFMRVIARRGAPDWFVTEYFRVHPDSVPHRVHPALDRGKRDRQAGVRADDRPRPAEPRPHRETARGIAGRRASTSTSAARRPIVCRKNAGGGLLREPEEINRLFGALREAIPGRFTVKTRVGYADEPEFPALLEIFRRHAIDGLTIHGRTVIERYQTPVHPDRVRQAVETMPCPVIANGNVVDVATGLAYLEKTGAAGLMIGRGAIRNPWIFAQLDAVFRDVRAARAEPPRPAGIRDRTL